MIQKVTAQIGNRMGIPKPNMKVTNTELRIVEYLKCIRYAGPARMSI
jgi:hypothetical protein